MILVIASWLVVGAIVGFAASKLVNLRGDDPLFGMAAAAAGAIVGGILFRLINEAGAPAWNPWNLLFAAAGAVVAVVGWHAVRSRYATHEPYTTRRSY